MINMKLVQYVQIIMSMCDSESTYIANYGTVDPLNARMISNSGHRIKFATFFVPNGTVVTVNILSEMLQRIADSHLS